MRLQTTGSRRSGAAIVEAAIVLPILLFLLYGITSGALMVFTADEVANSSREGARYASVRGSDYHFYTGKPEATAEEIIEHTKKQSVLLDKSRITCTVTWQSNNRPGGFVTVEVRYQWKSLGPFGDREFVSRSTMLVSY
jgi:Flp pilus assembly protein TadG